MKSDYKKTKKKKKVKKENTKKNEKYKIIKIRTYVEDDNKIKIKGDKGKQLFPSVVKWYKKTLNYLPFIKVEAVNYPYIKIAILNEDFEYIPTNLIADPDQDGNYPLYYRKKKYWIYGKLIKDYK